MLTTDLALRLDPAYEKISRRFFGSRRLADGLGRAAALSGALGSAAQDFAPCGVCSAWY